MYTTSDRRIKPRVICDYPAIIEGINGNGNIFNVNARLANLSASGLYMRVNREIDNGSKLSVTVLLTSALIDINTPKIATSGIVVRTEAQEDGTNGVAIKFTHYRFL